MKRVVVNAVSAKSGGSATYIRNLASELAQVEHQHQYIFYVPAAQVAGSNVKILEIDIGHRAFWRRFLWDQVALRRIIKKEGVDVVISSSDFGMLFPPCKEILMIRNSLFFSSLYLERILPHKTWRFKLEFLLRRWLIALSARSSDVVITASESMLDDVRHVITIPNGKAVVNYFGVPVEKFHGKSLGAGREREQALRMLYVSEYSDYKNLTTLLKAVICLRQRGFYDVCLSTTADPWQFAEMEVSTREEDQELARHPLVAPVVKFTGSVPYEDIRELYAESDLFVFPSLAESFGHPLVEAMASGLPILASDIPICREICGDAAEYFCSLDAEDLAEKIVLLKNSPELRRQLGQNGRNRAKAYFDWKDHVCRLIEIVERVAGTGREGVKP